MEQVSRIYIYILCVLLHIHMKVCQQDFVVLFLVMNRALQVSFCSSFGRLLEPVLEDRGGF